MIVHAGTQLGLAGRFQMTQNGRVKRAAVIALVAACSFQHGSDPTLARHDAAANDARPIDAPVDSGIDARACPPAPPTCVAFSCPSSPSCYYVCGTSTTGKQNWAGAQGSCMNAGVGCLATIEDQAEQNCIAIATVPSFPNALVWFGFRQSASGIEPAGDWGWECGTSSYVSPAWGDFEPNNGGLGEDCGAMTTSGAWMDVDCSGTARFVCELP